MKKKSPIANPQQSNPRSHKQTNDNSTTAQQQRLLERLRETPVSTVSARLELDILHPAARVQELREAGHNIVTHWRDVPTINDKMHHVAEYVLLSGKWKKRGVA